MSKLISYNRKIIEKLRQKYISEVGMINEHEQNRVRVLSDILNSCIHEYKEKAIGENTLALLNLLLPDLFANIFNKIKTQEKWA